MASTGTVTLSNAALGNISSVSVKINGDPTERYISLNQQTGLLTFNSLDDGFRYTYVILLTFNDQRVASAIFSHGCGEGTTTQSTTSTTSGTTTSSTTTSSTTSTSTTTSSTTTSSTTTPSCQEPTSVTIQGNLTPLINTTETYTLSVVGGQNNTYVWTASGGTISGSSTSNTVTVVWGDNTSVTSSISVSVGCTGGSNPAIDFDSFVLGVPETTPAPTTPEPTTTPIPFIQLSISSQEYLTSNEACAAFEATINIYRNNNGATITVGVGVFQESTLTNPYVPANTSSWYLLQEGVTRYAVQINSFGTISQLIAC